MPAPITGRERPLASLPPTTDALCSPMRRISDDLLHFVGTWSDAERRRIRRAVTTFERAWGPSARTSTAEEPEWMIVQETPPWGPYYFAHRFGTHDSLTGRSVEELAAVIERSSEKL